MPLELRDVDFADGPAIELVYLQAFYDDEFNKSLFPGMSLDNLLADAIVRWPQSYGAPNVYYKKVVDTDTGDIVSYSKWSFENTGADVQMPKKSDMPDGYVTLSPRTPEGLDGAFALEFRKKCDAVRDKLAGGRPLLVLKLLATSPSHQRRGAASLMLAWGTELAERQGLACWTVASPDGLSLYQKFGFKAHDSIVTPVLSGATYTSTFIMRE